jgi:hypothetical protein
MDAPCVYPEVDDDQEGHDPYQGGYRHQDLGSE